MPTKSTLHVDTQRRNFRMRHWPMTALDPLDSYTAIVDQAVKDRAAIDSDPHLTPEGKLAARAAKRDAAVKAIDALKTPRLAGLDANIAADRAALLPANTQKPTDRQIDFLLSRVQDRTANEIAVLYNASTDAERLVFEEAARSVGRIPTKQPDGSLVMLPLLPAEILNESQMARAAAQNPAGVQKLQELEEIKAMHQSVANLAAAEISEVLGS